MEESWAGSPFFTKKEMSCPCGCRGLPKDEFMFILVTIREEADFPFIVSSGYRCAAYNQQISDSGPDGPHVQGLAADIVVYGERALRLVTIGRAHGVTGFGISQKGELKKRFIHLDITKITLSRPRPDIWSY